MGVNLMLKKIWQLFIMVLSVFTLQISAMAAEESINEEAKITDFISYSIMSGQTASYHYDVPASVSAELSLKGKYGSPLSSTDPASVFGEDERYHVEDTEIFPNRFICYMECTFSDGTVNKCTGWLCGASTVMTVAHNVYRPERGWVKSIKVWPGKNEKSAPYGSALATEIHMPAAYKRLSVTKYDVAMLYLNTPIGNRTGYFGIKYRPESYVSSSVFIAGYPLNKNKQLWKAGGKILKAKPSELHYTIDTEEGQSGSPVYLGSGSERYCIGIHNGNQRENNVGNRITHCIFNWIQNKRK